MKILALKPGHDGSVAYLDDGKLVFSYEAEKDSFERHSDLTAQVVMSALTACPDVPDLVAIGGWHKTLPGLASSVAAGYHGLDPAPIEHGRLLGHDILLHSSTHERSHIFGGVAMSGLDPACEAAVLVYEGVLGAFYHWRGPAAPLERFDALDQPGARYSAMFALADASFPDHGRFPPSVYAGKLMALIGCADDQEPTQDSRNVVQSLLDIRSLYPFAKARYRQSALHNVGVEDAELCRAARLLSTRLFERFLDVAVRRLPPGLPLVVVGGCGLNCDWNTMWRRCGHFASVFVPPCADDSGSAIGSAVDAAVAAGEPCRVEWNVSSGAPFVVDAEPERSGWHAATFDAGALTVALAEGAVLAWVQGRCEIGPRALGHRSMLASAALPGMRDRLNEMKQREPYRPIAPMCLADELGRWFDDDFVDPYMLHFRRVLRPDLLPAVTHVDGSARVQAVDAGRGDRLVELLTAQRQLTGAGVLCNTSLNFSGTGFVNRMSELLHYCDLVGIDDVIVEDRWFRRCAPTAS